MKRITISASVKYVNEVGQWLFENAKELKPELDGIYRDFELQTSVGRLKIWLPIEQSYLFMCFARFDFPILANIKHGCNKHSGKFNIMCGGTVEEAIEKTIEHFKNL